MRHNEKSSGAKIDVFASVFGDIKLMRRDKSRCYYCYVDQGGFLYLRHVGSSDYDETLYFSSQVAKDESWPNGCRFFSDLRWLDSSAFTFDTHYKLAQDIAAHYDRQGRYFSAVVALCSNDFEFGMHRMFQSVFEDDLHPLNTVRDLDEAVEFLKIDRKLFDRVVAEIDRIDASEFGQDHA